ncbi:hypothetical protein F5X68DRAFT_233905 [Plectosphaerella plurivora]|uniref:Uncharacterized protein n=1 Tax=Plectosphaerella plurivora TaxID=936078 RepID=A0A9P8V5N4_9PEZI|nr:hypothetical protein F5X68DRAFT_233905 [Plectosphaerella plurivora]
MQPSTILSTILLLGAAQAQTLLRQCAVQGDGGYNVARTHDYTSAACSAAGGTLGTTQTGTIARGIACCTLTEAGRGAFNDRCRQFSDIPIGTPQPC